MNDQAQDLRNHVAKHGKADDWLSNIVEDDRVPPNHAVIDGKLICFHELDARSKLEWNARTLGFDMYEVAHMSDDTLQRIANLAEERFK